MSAEFGVARSVDAQSFGQPGQRTFRLRIIGEAQQSASLWMEKEQLQALSLALKQALGQLEYDREMPPRTIDDFPVVADHDFRIGRMGMGVNPGDTTVVLYLYELGTEDEDEPTLRVRFTPDDSAALAARLDEIIAGGRPVCPLCGLAIDPGGHACVRSNGHSKQPIPEEEDGEEES
ncbi:MAG TPA: DUF3090 family protein [Dehalococcoidia bacterium]|nr:DUF3090 family protein [Dehalococcoidia bacterium]